MNSTRDTDPHFNHTPEVTDHTRHCYTRASKTRAILTEVIEKTTPTSARLQGREMQQERRPVPRQLMEGKVKCLASHTGAGHMSRL